MLASTRVDFVQLATSTLEDKLVRYNNNLEMAFVLVAITLFGAPASSLRSVSRLVSKVGYGY